MITEAIATEILAFWFLGDGGVAMDYPTGRKRWFRKSPAFDAQVRQRFEAVYESAYDQAVTGPGASEGQGLDAWVARYPPAEQRLALTLLFDQLPRNMFRRTPRAFAADYLARTVAQGAIAAGVDQALPPLQRMFFYFPLEHSEFGADQQQSVQLFAAIAAQAPELQDTYDYALRHQQIIARFGRFPHRNPILGRRSTAAEVSFLKQPGSSF